MSRRFVVLFLAFFTICIGGIGFFLFHHFKKSEVKSVVSSEYMNEQKWIKSYGKDQDIQYLSESIGQYMTYLLLIEDHAEFNQQVDVLKKNYLVEKDGQVYIKWQLAEGTATNALVDDLRIIEALSEGGELFQEPSYSELAAKLKKTIELKQSISGMMVDFYDWELEKATTTLHLSYLNHNVLQAFESTKTDAYLHLLRGAVDSPFFYEIYDVENKVYQAADQKNVNMIDQLLIAIQYHKWTGKVPTEFDQWLKKELDSKGKLFGAYQKGSLEPAVPYESSAVYALGVLYFFETGDPSYADVLHELLLKQPPFERDPDFKTIHFFDYMYSKTADELWKQRDGSY
ncbi:hypothetical protein [Mesobacillus maritimus]|uniref:Glycoside transferase n=1 Tax=Mesobacillus maritimus TaxID=1643336 RepID=A0ABS7K5F3_9BACI|nr:hypothetical protein [Mesobacillus maritimus]MBY0097340.1 hypothetical protein [Mesobacillus maritimus]